MWCLLTPGQNGPRWLYVQQAVIYDVKHILTMCTRETQRIPAIHVIVQRIVFKLCSTAMKPVTEHDRNLERLTDVLDDCCVHVGVL